MATIVFAYIDFSKLHGIFSEGTGFIEADSLDMCTLIDFVRLFPIDRAEI